MRPYEQLCWQKHGVVGELKLGIWSVGGDQLLQVSQTGASPSPGSLVCAWQMLEPRVLSVGSAEGMEPSCESGFTTGSGGDFMQLYTGGSEHFLLQ